MKELKRERDITPIEQKSFTVFVDGQETEAVQGETVLAVMMSTGTVRFMENDHQNVSGEYCGMGVCHACHVKINQQYKRKACQTLIEPNMHIYTETNRFNDIGIEDLL